MKKQIILILFFLFVFSNRNILFSQNLVPNGSFEAGASSPTVGTADFDSNCSPWETAQFSVGSSGGGGTSGGIENHGCGNHPWYRGDWGSPTTDNNFQDIINCSSPIYPSNSFVRLKSSTVQYQPYCINYCRHHSGVRVQLQKNGSTYTLIKGATYTMRVKLRTGTSSTSENHNTINNNLRVHFSMYSLHWNTDPDAAGSTNRKFSDAVDFGISPPSFSPCEWYSFQKSFTVPNSTCDGSGGCDYLSNLILFLDDANDVSYDGDLSIDDVELYEGGCGGNWNIEDWHYTFYETPYEFQIITAGYDAGIPSLAGDVVVEPSANVTYKANQEVALLPGFGVEAGGIFHAYIAPCGLDCFPAIADAGDNVESCLGQSFQLGGITAYGSTYSWSASPASGLSYLSNTSTSNPIFNPPPIGFGTIIYTLTATNSCGQTASDQVVVSYENAPNNTATVSVSNIVYSDLIEFDVNCGPQTGEIIIEVLTASGFLLNTYNYYVGVDFTCCSFHWQIPNGLNPCQDYQLRVKTRNLCSTYLSVPIVYIYWTRNRIPGFTFVPNVLTPNGDGVNDSWCYEFTGASQSRIEIFNPSGVKVYDNTTTTIPPYACVWNGECNQPSCSTSTVPNGTYFYILTLNACDGSNTSTNGFISVLFGRGSTANDSLQNFNPTPQITNIPKELVIFPNPNNGLFQIKKTTDSNPISLKEIKIYDVMGKIVWETGASSNNIFYVDISSNSQGIYYVRCVNEMGEIETYKLVKQE